MNQRKWTKEQKKYKISDECQQISTKHDDFNRVRMKRFIRHKSMITQVICDTDLIQFNDINN